MDDPPQLHCKWQENVNMKTDMKKLVTSNYTNKEIVAIMLQRFPEYCWSLATLKRRLKAFNIKRVDTNVDPDQLLSVLKVELDGPGQCLGIRAMHKKIRENHNLLVTRGPIQFGAMMAMINSVEETNTNFHLEFMAVLTVFQVLWMKVWPTNSSPELPGKLFIDTVETLGVYPEFTRSDKGTETILIAPMQMFLSGSSNRHMYGSSTTNQVIERWWRGCREMQGDFFKNKLIELRRDGQYFAEKNTCRVLLAFVYMDIIQQSLDEFVSYWNNHRIRRQDIHRPCGIVNFLYECPEACGGKQCGKVPDCDKLQYLKSKVDGLKNLRFLDEESERVFKAFLEEEHMLPITLRNVNECYKALYVKFGHIGYDFIYS